MRTLRRHGALTMALILRSLLEGERKLAASALAELSGQTYARAAAFARDPYGHGFAALALKSGIPRHALPAFRAALRAIETCGAGRGEGLKPRLVQATIAACEAERDSALAPILSLLWRFAVEAARTMARAAAAAPHLPPALALPPPMTRAARGTRRRDRSRRSPARIRARVCKSRVRSTRRESETRP